MPALQRGLALLGLLALPLLGWTAWQALQRPDARVLPVQEVPGRVDVGFAQHMMLHHDQALQLAQILRARGAGRLAGLADGIVLQQAMEIGQLRGWLQMWGQPLLPATRNMDWMLNSGSDAEQFAAYLALCQRSGGMPGLASQDELNQLRELQGAALERAFLRLMVRHHQGALPMADYARQHADTTLVRALAGQMLMEQGQEVVQMQALDRRS